MDDSLLPSGIVCSLHIMSCVDTCSKGLLQICHKSTTIDKGNDYFFGWHFFHEKIYSSNFWVALGVGDYENGSCKGKF